MATGFLRVEGTQVIGDDGVPVILRGAGLGGWMNMENFITGFPGHESQHRDAMLKALGQEKYDFFFDRFLEHFFAEADARFFASMGLNCLRLGFNYRHFEDDMRPRVLKEGGFKHLDRVIKLCADHGIYTILDLHAAPGGQNPDWHADNLTNQSLFWTHLDFQDRTIWLWEQLAARYGSDPWVAGYNLLNEPCDPSHVRLPAFYARLAAAIRKIDQRHILWLDGNTFAMEWRGFDAHAPLENAAYSLHDYSSMGFPRGERYRGTAEQKEKVERQFLRKARYMHERDLPVWNGEFGPVYADKDLDGPEAASINEERYALLAEQLRVYDKYRIHWSIWLYKDIGYQGMLYAAPESAYMRTIAPMLAKKRELQVDAWGRRPAAEIDAIMAPLVKWIDEKCPASRDAYPTPWATERQVSRLVLQLWVAGCLQDEFAALFGDMSMEELEECAKSFAFAGCVQREGLNRTLEEHARLRVDEGDGAAKQAPNVDDVVLDTE